MNVNSEQPTIMVVDDTPENLKLLQNMLHVNDYRVLTFPNGKLALTAAANNPPDLILLDVMMPEMDGYEVCRALKDDDKLKEIPVLFISALHETSDKVKAFAVGGVDYVTKPFQEEEVHARIRAHLELRRQRRELQEAYDQLQKLETLRDNLTHMIVHDMRSSLNVMVGSLDLLGEEIPEDPDTRELHQMTEGAARELTRMCNGLLDVSRLEAGQMPVQREPCDLSSVASEVIATLKTQASSASVTVQSEIAPVQVQADKSLLQRILDNLLTNAIKYTPAGGTVTIRAATSPDGVRVEVADTGQGISPEHHDKIFEKFGQIEAQEKKSGQRHSAGLGLTFCKLAIEAHQGNIGVESTVGQGSVFWFLLPHDESRVGPG